jgi:hypothetical protein
MPPGCPVPDNPPEKTKKKTMMNMHRAMNLQYNGGEPMMWNSLAWMYMKATLDPVLYKMNNKPCPLQPWPP